MLAAATAATMMVLPVASGHAEPKPTLQQVQQKISALNAKIEMVNEDFEGSRLELAVASRDAAVAGTRVRAAQADLRSAQRGMAAFAAAAYRNGAPDQFVQLVATSTPQTFLDRASTLDRIAASESSQLAAAATARHRLEQVQAEASAKKDALAVIAKRMATQKQVIESALATQQQLLHSLKADEQRRLRAIQQAALDRAAAAARAARSRNVTAPTDVATYNGPGSGRAAIAVKEAYAQLGKPYQWAAAGPDRFDCSGLTLWVWGKAGVSLPHQSRAQYAGGRKVAQADLQPGDLTFYGSPIHHVGIYVGDGQMISAPQTGDVVKIQNALRSDYVGAVRP